MKELKNILISMRPEQWTKNIIVFAGLFFAKKLNDPSTVVLSFEIFCIFCLISSASYIFNDLVDRKEDTRHPDKCKRPIARGTLGTRIAAISALFLGITGMIWAFVLSYQLFYLAVTFVILHVAYDIVLKHIAIIDVFAIAFAFIIRLLAGVSMSSVETLISSWILLCTFLLALFFSAV